jgi:hypothetical protein
VQSRPCGTASLSLMELYGPSRTRTRSPRVGMGSTRPVRRSERPAGIDSSAPARQPKRLGGPPWTSTLLQRTSPGPRAVPPVARQVRRHLLSWAFVALRHSIRMADPLADRGPLHGRVPRAGFGYPLRDMHHHPYRRPKTPERPWASPFKVFPSPRSVPLSGPMPSCRCRDASKPPRREAGATGPATGPSSRDESVLAPEPQGLRPSIPSWGSPHQSILPSDLALALVRGASPLTLGRLDVPTRPGLRVSGCE